MCALARKHLHVSPDSALTRRAAPAMARAHLLLDIIVSLMAGPRAARLQRAAEDKRRAERESHLARESLAKWQLNGAKSAPKPARRLTSALSPESINFTQPASRSTGHSFNRFERIKRRVEVGLW